MADQTETYDEAEEQTKDGEESNGGHKAVRAAAIAAATGATAFAAKKAFSSREQSQESGGTSKRGSSAGDESMVAAMIASGWAAAKDSLIPVVEDGAEAAGEWLARGGGPDFIADTLVPRFIRGYEKARRKSGDSE